MSEQWQPVVGYEGLYRVSAQGEVESCRRIIRDRAGRRRHVGGNLLTTFGRGGRCKTVLLRKNGKMYNLAIRPIVAAAWLGPKPPGMRLCGPVDSLKYQPIRDPALSTLERDPIRRSDHYEFASCAAASDILGIPALDIFRAAQSPDTVWVWV